MKWLATPRDPLAILCQRVAYANLVRRAAQGLSIPRDCDWLSHAMSILELSPDDFASDVQATREGQTPPRLAGEWPEPEPLVIEEIDDTAFQAVE